METLHKHSERKQRCYGTSCDDTRKFYAYCVPADHPDASRLSCGDHPGRRIVILHGDDPYTRHHKGRYGKPCTDTTFHPYWQPEVKAEVEPIQEEDRYSDPEPVKAEPEPVKAKAEDLVALAELLAKLGAGQVDEDKVREIAETVARTAVEKGLEGVSAPLKLTVHDALTGQDIDLDDELVHHVVPKVLAYLSLGFNVWLCGPAGTGKSTIAQTCAKALSAEFGSISLAPNMPLSEVTGYWDANGNYNRTVFRDRYEHGGMFLWDEMDNGHAAVIAKQNMALANGHMAFPDGMVAKHERSYTIAAANTFGTGPDAMYSRQKLDVATLDRFWTVYVDTDEDLEAQACGFTGRNKAGERFRPVERTPEQAQDEVNTLVRFVRALRAKVAETNMPVVFSQRSTIEGSKAIRAGVPMADVISDRVRKGISDTDWQKLTASLTVPS